MAAPLLWDVFCTVVDNFGDAGVCWRLARQLVHEHDQRVRLWIDDLGKLARICPGVDAAAARQVVEGVEIHHWSAEPIDVTPGDVVVEAFACELPDAVVQAMVSREPPPVWLNLEYLSAEDWVAGCHGLTSPHPRLPLVKHFWFPGFVPGTGGLLGERDLAQRRAAFLGEGAGVDRFWASLDVPPPAPGTTKISLFCYDNPVLPELLSAWANGPRPALCLVPEGLALRAVGEWLQEQPGPGESFVRGNLTLQVLPFLPQARYDELLWACDCNFVRGEDSFVRAQWAQVPFAWQIYRQEEDAHQAKLLAFLDLYCAGLPADAEAALRRFWDAWNGSGGVAEAWPEFHAQFPLLRAHAERWAMRLNALGDAATNLVQFCKDLLE